MNFSGSTTYNNFTINLRGLWTDRTWVSLGDERYTMRANYARFTLDLDMTWQITKRFGVYVTGNNITNAAKSSYINNPGALYEANLYCSIWQIGIKGQF
jgi:hypothetical protein